MALLNLLQLQNFLSIINQRIDLNDFFKKLARLRSAWHEEHQNFLKNATTITQTIIQNLNKVNVKTHRISANAIDREFNILKEHEKREAQENLSSPVIRVQALTADSRNKKAVPCLRGSLPNASRNNSRSSSPQKQKSLDDSVADSIAGFERQVELNAYQVEKAIASSKAVGYKTLLDTKLDHKSKRSLTLAEAWARKAAAEKKDPSRHFKVAWQDVDLYQTVQETAKRSVLDYLSNKLGGPNDPTKIHRLEPKRNLSTAESRRTFVRSSSTHRLMLKQQPSPGRLSCSQSRSDFRPQSTASMFHSMAGLNFAGAFDSSPESNQNTNRGSPFSPDLVQSEFFEQRKNELEAIEEKDMTAKIEAMIFQPQVGCYVNAEFPKLIPRLKLRTKSASDDRYSKLSNSARSSVNDFVKLAGWNEPETRMPSGRSESVVDMVSTSHRPFYSNGNVSRVSKMKGLHKVVKSLKSAR